MNKKIQKKLFRIRIRIIFSKLFKIVRSIKKQLFVLHLFEFFTRLTNGCINIS